MTYKLDLKDRKILYELDSNARQSNVQIAKKVGLSKEVVNYRIKKLEQNNIIKTYFTEIDTSKLGFISYKLYVQFQNVSKAIEEEIQSFLLNNNRNNWTAFCTGRWDIIFGFWAKDVKSINDYMVDFINRFNRYILNKELTSTLQFFIFSFDWILENNIVSNRKISQIGGSDKVYELDPLSLRILEEIAHNCKMNVIDLAKKYNTNSSTIIKKINFLKEKKIIRAFKAYPNINELGYSFYKSFIYANNLSSKNILSFRSYCKSNPNITALTECVGTWDLEIEIFAKTFERYNAIMNEIKLKFPDLVRNYESVTITDETGIKYLLS